MIKWKWSRHFDVMKEKLSYPNAEQFGRYLELLEYEEVDEQNVGVSMMGLVIRDEIDKELIKKMKEYTNA